ncbi:DUF1031 family protein [Lactococcus fujiensis]|uniref:DUF1031 family protein n=1 Tax=Lactococcus fujiensis TaxID=610251 RepID=UPI000BDF3694|nr:DUF1031 family protein [Lactococcus fujiensis]
MSVFEALTLINLYNTAEQKFLSGRGKDVVWIEAKKEDKLLLIQTYQDICGIYNRGKFMSWEHLFRLLRKKMNGTVIVLP